MTAALELPAIQPPDGTARASVLTLGGADETVQSPAGPFGLGRLATAASWLAGCQGVCPPRPIQQARVVVFGDAPQGSTPLAVLAEAAGAGVRVVQTGFDDVQAAVRAGMAAADDEVDSGADLLIAANLGADSTTVAAVLVAALTGTEPVAVVGRGAGIDDQGWMRKTAAVRDALRQAKPHLAEPLELLAAAGGADVAALSGFLLQAAARRTPVLLGGLTVCAAAVIAEELAPGAREWWLASSTSTEPAHALALEHLDLEPLLDLQLGGDAQEAGVLALPLLAAAARALAATDRQTR